MPPAPVPLNDRELDQVKGRAVMEQTIATLIKDFEDGKMDRRQLIKSLAVLALACTVLFSDRSESSLVFWAWAWAWTAQVLAGAGFDAETPPVASFLAPFATSFFAPCLSPERSPFPADRRPDGSLPLESVQECFGSI